MIFEKKKKNYQHGLSLKKNLFSLTADSFQFKFRKDEKAAAGFKI